MQAGFSLGTTGLYKTPSPAQGRAWCAMKRALLGYEPIRFAKILYCLGNPKKSSIKRSFISI